MTIKEKYFNKIGERRMPTKFYIKYSNYRDGRFCFIHNRLGQCAQWKKDRSNITSITTYSLRIRTLYFL